MTVNGKRFQPNQKLEPSSYAKIDRTWKNGDRVDVKLPMRLHLRAIPDDPTLAAIMYGPLVLAGELGTENLDSKRIYSDDKFLHGGFPAIAVPELAGDRNLLDQHGGLREPARAFVAAGERAALLRRCRAQ